MDEILCKRGQRIVFLLVDGGLVDFISSDVFSECIVDVIAEKDVSVVNGNVHIVEYGQFFSELKRLVDEGKRGKGFKVECDGNMCKRVEVSVDKVDVVVVLGGDVDGVVELCEGEGILVFRK